MKIALKSLLALVLVAEIGLLFVNHNEVEGLRAEQQQLTETNREAARLAAENQELEQLRKENEEVKRLRLANKDLLKLRNEVRQLRRDAEEAERLRAENERLAAIQQNGLAQRPARQRPEGFIAKENLVDAGFATPEAAIQTYFWAIVNGNIKHLILSTTEAGKVHNYDPEQVRKGFATTYKNFDGFAITGKKETSPDGVALTLQSFVDGGSVDIQLRRIGNEWKVEN